MGHVAGMQHGMASESPCRRTWLRKELPLRLLVGAQAKLREFLALMPAEQREAAAGQLASLPF